MTAIKLPSVKDRDAALKEYVESTSFVDENGDPYFADGEIPDVPDPDDDTD